MTALPPVNPVSSTAPPAADAPAQPPPRPATYPAPPDSTGVAGAAALPARRRLQERRWWPWLKRGVTLSFFGLVLLLLASQARNIAWGDVLTALQDYPLRAAWGAVGLAALSFTLYSCFDLLGRHYTGHTLSTATVMTTTFVSYVFNLNMGSIVGGVALRYRLYSRLGLGYGVITRVMSMSMLANWMGYVLLAGLVFSIRPPITPADWPITSGQLRLIGFVLVGVAGAYLAACAFSRQREFILRGHVVDLPSFRLASLQLGMGASNWLVMSGIIFILLQQRVEFPAVVSVLLVAAIAGVITHVPAGLGVLEAVFVALLSHLMPESELLAALVAYRVIYYITPLVLATVVYVALETRARRLARQRRAPAGVIAAPR